jgi:hypothetical protein
MNEDSWMRELGRVAAEEEEAELRRFAAWERLSAGELSGEEEAALAKQAETSAEARLAYEAFRPLGPEFEARMVRTLVAAQDLPAPGAVAAPAAPILTFPRYARHFGWLAAAATSAALLVLLVVTRRPSPPLPSYALEISGGLRTKRGEAAGSMPIFRRGSEIAVVLRPPTQAAGLTEARCCFLVHGEAWRSWPLAAEQSGQSFKFTGRLDSGLEPGEWRLWAVAGRPGSLPDEAALLSLLRQARERQPGWQAVAKEFFVE